MGVAVENIELVAGELRQRLGTDAVLTDEGLLDAYEADTYWKAIASRASGSPLGRPDLVVLAGSDEDVATVLELANQFGVPVVPWGGGSGTQGGAILTHGGIAARPEGSRPDRRGRRGVADRDGRGGRQRPAARGRAERARADAPALPRVGRVGDGRRLRRRARLRRALDALRQDRGPRPLAARRDPDRRG